MSLDDGSLRQLIRTAAVDYEETPLREMRHVELLAAIIFSGIVTTVDAAAPSKTALALSLELAKLLVKTNRTSHDS